MQPVKLPAIALTIILIYGFGSITFAKEIKTNYHTLNTPSSQNNINKIKTPEKDITSPQKAMCRRFPFCR